MEQSKITIYAGEGRGKSSAALGCALTAASEGKRAVVIQFLKKRTMADSAFYKRLEPEIKFFRFEKSEDEYDRRSDENKQADAENIRNGLAFARKVLSTGQCDLLILDEVLGVLNNHIISVEELRGILEDHADTDVILTGKRLDPEICTFADEILDISRVRFKHFG